MAGEITWGSYQALEGTDFAAYMVQQIKDADGYPRLKAEFEATGGFFSDSDDCIYYGSSADNKDLAIVLADCEYSDVATGYRFFINNHGLLEAYRLKNEYEDIDTAKAKLSQMDTDNPDINLFVKIEDSELKTFMSKFNDENYGHRKEVMKVVSSMLRFHRETLRKNVAEATDKTTEATALRELATFLGEMSGRGLGDSELDKYLPDDTKIEKLSKIDYFKHMKTDGASLANFPALTSEIEDIYFAIAGPGDQKNPALEVTRVHEKRVELIKKILKDMDLGGLKLELDLTELTKIINKYLTDLDSLADGVDPNMAKPNEFLPEEKAPLMRDLLKANFLKNNPDYIEDSGLQEDMEALLGREFDSENTIFVRLKDQEKYDRKVFAIEIDPSKGYTISAVQVQGFRSSGSDSKSKATTSKIKILKDYTESASLSKISDDSFKDYKYDLSALKKAQTELDTLIANYSPSMSDSFYARPLIVMALKDRKAKLEVALEEIIQDFVASKKITNGIGTGATKEKLLEALKVIGVKDKDIKSGQLQELIESAVTSPDAFNANLVSFIDGLESINKVDLPDLEKEPLMAGLMDAYRSTNIYGKSKIKEAMLQIARKQSLTKVQRDTLREVLESQGVLPENFDQLINEIELSAGEDTSLFYQQALRFDPALLETVSKFESILDEFKKIDSTSKFAGIDLTTSELYSLYNADKIPESIYTKIKDIKNSAGKNLIEVLNENKIQSVDTQLNLLTLLFTTTDKSTYSLTAAPALLSSVASELPKASDGFNMQEFMSNLASTDLKARVDGLSLQADYREALRMPVFQFLLTSANENEDLSRLKEMFSSLDPSAANYEEKLGEIIDEINKNFSLGASKAFTEWSNENVTRSISFGTIANQVDKMKYSFTEIDENGDYNMNIEDYEKLATLMNTFHLINKDGEEFDAVNPDANSFVQQLHAMGYIRDNGNKAILDTRKIIADLSREMNFFLKNTYPAVLAVEADKQSIHDKSDILVMQYLTTMFGKENLEQHKAAAKVLVSREEMVRSLAEFVKICSELEVKQLPAAPVPVAPPSPEPTAYNLPSLNFGDVLFSLSFLDGILESGDKREMQLWAA